MAVHLIKLAVGVDSIEHLSQIQDRHRHENRGVLRHLTRNTPKRSKELIADGSIYWVIKGFIRVRQRIIGFEEAIARTKDRTKVDLKSNVLDVLKKELGDFELNI